MITMMKRRNTRRRSRPWLPSLLRTRVSNRRRLWNSKNLKFNNTSSVSPTFYYYMSFIWIFESRWENLLLKYYTDVHETLCFFVPFFSFLSSFFSIILVIHNVSLTEPHNSNERRGLSFVKAVQDFVSPNECARFYRAYKSNQWWGRKNLSFFRMSSNYFFVFQKEVVAKRENNAIAEKCFVRSILITYTRCQPKPAHPWNFDPS